MSGLGPFSFVGSIGEPGNLRHPGSTPLAEATEK